MFCPHNGTVVLISRMPGVKVRFTNVRRRDLRDCCLVSYCVWSLFSGLGSRAYVLFFFCCVGWWEVSSSQGSSSQSGGVWLIQRSGGWGLWMEAYFLSDALLTDWSKARVLPEGECISFSISGFSAVICVVVSG